MGSNGDLESGFKSAFTGGISGGINSFYGADYPASRAVANGIAGGTGAVLGGGRFEDGFKTSFVISSLVYLNVQMRQNVIDNSLLDKTTNENGRMVNDGTGLSKGMFGDMFKLARGRFLRDAKGCSILGCDQSGPGFIGSMSYESGSFVDMVLESFAGPHDTANSRWFYNEVGSIGTVSTALDLVTNYTTSLIFATPFAIAAVSEQTYFQNVKFKENGK